MSCYFLKKKKEKKRKVRESERERGQARKVQNYNWQFKTQNTLKRIKCLTLTAATELVPSFFAESAATSADFSGSGSGSCHSGSMVFSSSQISFKWPCLWKHQATQVSLSCSTKAFNVWQAYKSSYPNTITLFLSLSLLFFQCKIRLILWLYFLVLNLILSHVCLSHSLLPPLYLSPHILSVFIFFSSLYIQLVKYPITLNAVTTSNRNQNLNHIRKYKMDCTGKWGWGWWGKRKPKKPMLSLHNH